MITFKQFIGEANHVDNEDGSLVWSWWTNKRFDDDEGEENYLPKGYKKALELGGVFANIPGKGQGDRLMKMFLASTDAQAAELIFLDPVPNIGANFGSDLSTDQQIERLKKFYAKYGFRNNPRSNRMWLVKKGSIPDDKLPT